MWKVSTGYCGTNEIQHGLCACTVDNPLAKARGLSLHTGAQTMVYLSLIRPLLEYSNVAWDNCTDMITNDLDKIQNEAARIATGATKLVSLNALSKEICWESLGQRRKNHRLTLFYKMFYNITPLYLSNLVPQSVSNLSRYNLRNSNDLQTVDARSSQYYHSFLPSTTRDWNNLSIGTNKPILLIPLNIPLIRTNHPYLVIFILVVEKDRFFTAVFELIVAY